MTDRDKGTTHAESCHTWGPKHYDCLKEKYASAVRTLQDIAAMGKKAGSESAAHRLAQLGEPREP